MNKREQRMQMVKNCFSPETTDDEVILFLLNNPFSPSTGAVMIEGYMSFRNEFNMSPYQSLLEEMDCLFSAMEAIENEIKDN